jgi:hypothetical protein
MGVGRTAEGMSDMSECEVLDMFGTQDCAYPVRNILGRHKTL